MCFPIFTRTTPPATTGCAQLLVFPNGSRSKQPAPSIEKQICSEDKFLYTARLIRMQRREAIKNWLKKALCCGDADDTEEIPMPVIVSQASLDN